MNAKTYALINGKKSEIPEINPHITIQLIYDKTPNLNPTAASEKGSALESPRRGR